MRPRENEDDVNDYEIRTLDSAERSVELARTDRCGVSGRLKLAEISPWSEWSVEIGGDLSVE